ncbi:peptidase M23 [Couchioplanes caeruleus subsp. caeruleus]|uniref:Peptidase M23 n=1 Tax=Couchioplanes caeruleus subsp. caeruleus TaxID=56427 RepID=A0A1K0GG49_9ACTN|nr:peptidase M23 [Couchioplanes caeruleus subsp. caeruleus]
MTVAALSLAACGAPEEGPSATATPQFLEPSTAPASAPVSAGPASATPSAAAPSKSPAPTSKPPAAGKAPANVKYVFPVQASNADYHPTHSGYPATDIFADCGEPVVATTSGVVLEISLKDAYVKGRPDGPLNGGLYVSILGDDGVRYYGSHLSSVKSGIEPGVRVRAGQQLGKVGRTGNANNVCHLHYGISPPCAEVGDWDVRRGVVWPAPYLTSWRKGGGRSPVAEVESWEKAHRCKG